MCSKRRLWTDAEIATVRRKYPDTPTAQIARELGRTASAVYGRADALGLHKSEAYLASPAACRLRRGDDVGKAHRFRKGHATWNKGKEGWTAGGRSAETRFRKGEMHGAAQHNYVPIGSERIVYGNLERKVTDDPNVYPAARWRPVHRAVWEAANGPVPKGRLCVFRPGMHTTDEAEITLDRLECITRGENMRRNSYHTRYPKSVGRLIQLRGALNRKINTRRREHAEQI